MGFENQKIDASREAFASNEEQVAEKKRAIAEAVAAGDYDKVAALAQETKGLEGDKQEMMRAAQEEATAENTERDIASKKESDHAEALEMNRAFDESKAAEAAAQKRARIAEEDRLRAEADVAAAAKLAEQIKGGNLGAEARPVEVVQEIPAKNSVEEIAAPQTETFKKYGSKMREDAGELVVVVKEMGINNERLREVAYKSAEWQKIWNENEALNDRRNKLRSSIMHGEYQDAALDDPQTALSLAQSGELGSGYHENEGLGQLSIRLRSNAQYMWQLLDALPANHNSENFWVHVRGEARKNRELYIAAVKKNHLNYQFGPKEWTTDPEIQKIALESGLDSMYLQK